MVTSRKVVLSLLLSVLLFSVITVLAYTGLFDLIETRFYNPTIITSITRDNALNAEVIDGFLTETQSQLHATIKTQTVRRSFLSNQQSGDYQDYAQIYSLLIESAKGIQWVRFIDAGGFKIHFSTLDRDIQYQDGSSVSYHNFQETGFLYSDVSVLAGEQPKYVFDESSRRILFSFPLYDFFDTYWGTALFSLSVDALLDQLIAEGRIKFGQDITIISNPPGLLFGATISGERAMVAQISSIWRDGTQRFTKLVSPASNISLILISLKTPKGIFVGRLTNEELFSLPIAMKIILLASLFITVYLTFFLAFNIKQDPVAVVQNRMKQFQISLIEQFYELKGEKDWALWIRELELRRDEIVAQVKHGIEIAPSSKNKEIDVLVHKSLDELLSMLGGGVEKGIDEEQLQSTVKRILAELTSAPVQKLAVAHAPISESAVSGGTGLLRRASAIVKEIEETDQVEELEELDAVDEEPAKEEPTFGAGAGDGQGMTRSDLEYLASKIEFSTDSEADFFDDEAIKEDLEIVSPFSSMLSDLSPIDDAGANETDSQDKNNTIKEHVIEEREGVPYIKEEAANTDSDSELDKDFKDLVDSITK